MNRTLLLGGLLLGALLPSVLAGGDHGHGGGHHPDHVESPMLQQGQSFTANFTLAATHQYHCHPHPQMKGSIVVSPDAPEGNQSVEIRAFQFLPKEVRVRPNASITWTNQDSVPHTVTMLMADEHGAHDTPGLAATAVLLGLGAAALVARRR